jgi:putative monooxygenase
MTTMRPHKVSATDVPPNRRRGGDLRVTLSSKTSGATSGFGGVLRLAPGEFVSEHYHPYSEEFVHVIAGDLKISVGEVELRLGPADSLLIPIGVRHRAVNVGKAQAHLVFHLSPLAPRPDLGHVDTEPLPCPNAAVPQVGQAP